MTAARSYHHGNLRAALLTGAEQTLAEGGDLSLRELARRIGVSHAAPRRHFADKQALLDALALDGFERLGAELAEALAASAPGAEGRMLAFATTYVRFATQHAALLDLMYTGKKSAPEVSEAAERAFAASLTLFRDGQASGEIVAGDTQEVAMVAFATCQGLASLINSGMLPEGALDDLVAEAVARLVHGLRPRSVGG